MSNSPRSEEGLASNQPRWLPTRLVDLNTLAASQNRQNKIVLLEDVTNKELFIVCPQPEAIRRLKPTSLVKYRTRDGGQVHNTKVILIDNGERASLYLLVNLLRRPLCDNSVDGNGTTDSNLPFQSECTSSSGKQSDGGPAILLEDTLVSSSTQMGVNDSPILMEFCEFSSISILPADKVDVATETDTVQVRNVNVGTEKESACKDPPDIHYGEFDADDIAEDGEELASLSSSNTHHESEKSGRTRRGDQRRRHASPADSLEDSCEGAQRESEGPTRPDSRDDITYMSNGHFFPVDQVVDLLAKNITPEELFVHLHRLVFSSKEFFAPRYTDRKARKEHRHYLELQYERNTWINNQVLRCCPPDGIDMPTYYRRLNLALDTARNRNNRVSIKAEDTKEKFTTNFGKSETKFAKDLHSGRGANQCSGTAATTNLEKAIQDDPELAPFIIDCIFSTYCGPLTSEVASSIDRLLRLTSGATINRHSLLRGAYMNVTGSIPPSEDVTRRMSYPTEAVQCPDCQISVKRKSFDIHLSTFEHVETIVANYKQKRARKLQTCVTGPYEEVLADICQDLRFPLSHNHLVELASNLKLSFGSILLCVQKSASASDSARDGSLYVDWDEQMSSKVCKLNLSGCGTFGTVDRNSARYASETNKHVVSKAHVSNVLTLKFDDTVTSNTAQAAEDDEDCIYDGESSGGMFSSSDSDTSNRHHRSHKRRRTSSRSPAGSPDRDRYSGANGVKQPRNSQPTDSPFAPRKRPTAHFQFPDEF